MKGDTYGLSFSLYGTIVVSSAEKMVFYLCLMKSFNKTFNVSKSHRKYVVVYHLCFLCMYVLDLVARTISYQPPDTCPERSYICNPITKEYVMLPEIKTNCDRQYHDWTSGFGYVSSSNEYKVVGMYLNNWDQYAEIHIYTLGSGDGWRNLGKLNHEFDTYLWCHGIFANGALYWMDNAKEMIVTFNLAKEKFHESLSPPPLCTPADEWMLFFGWDVIFWCLCTC
ncbi:F-box/kelch-repeat protein At3g06240-like [Papaver somniferum]|uniref:F-box/kelch-repeat protein At3g06240-like n=1 Tax=Papaver somniferum TaxID=3469 RepID=UPI000E6F8875|nr:F-box/kelch-repeat protein At3g06240-like [Papaver somniferum]